MTTKGVTDVAGRPRAYADPSFLISFYGNDSFTFLARSLVQAGSPGTATARGLMLLVCELNRFEFANALRLMQFRKLASARTTGLMLTAFETDRQAGLVRTEPLPWPQVFVIAERLSVAHTAGQGHRGMDTLHVAACLAVSATHFYSFDDRQRLLARQEGLLLNPI